VDRLTALLYFVLSLLGIDPGGSTLVHRTGAADADALHSRATVQAGVARFECLRSASGRCHYLVLPHDCAPASTPGSAAGCASRPVARFALDDGESRQIAGLQNFRLCVGIDESLDCEAPARPAAR
jgi:hypothetical protein